MKNKLQELLDFDPIKEAEEVFGRKTEISSKLGFVLALASNAAKNELLTSLKDTRFSTPVDEYLEIASRLGFEIILREDFQKPDVFHWQDNLDQHQASEYTKESQYFVLWNSADSVLLYFDTYSSYGVDKNTGTISFSQESVNGGKFCYNWISNGSRYLYTSSGGYYKPKDMSWDEFNALPESEQIWVGDHDCREALAHNYTQLKENGIFVKNWKEKPFYSMLHHSEWGLVKAGEFTVDELTGKRIAKLPEEVKCVINLY